MEDQETPVIRESVRFVGTDDALGNLYAALASAQAEFLPIVKDSTAKVQMKAGGQYTFDYAGLDVIIAATAPALTKHGLAMMQFPSGDDLLTVLAFGGAGGPRIESRCPITNWTDAQAFGSAITYFKRYARLSILSVFPASEDDDGGAASGNRTTVTPRSTPPALKPADPVKPKSDLSPATKAKIGELGKKVGFNREELEAFSVRNGSGPLNDLTETSGLGLAVALGEYQVKP